MRQANRLQRNLQLAPNRPASLADQCPLLGEERPTYVVTSGGDLLATIRRYFIDTICSNQ